MLDREWQASNLEEPGVETSAPPKRAAAPSEKVETAPPFSEFSGGVSRAFLIAWGLFAFVILAAFLGHLDVAFNLGVVMTFGGVFFGVPLILLRIKRDRAPKPKSYIDTENGRFSQTQAMIQIIMVPVILTFGMAVIAYFATHQ